AGNFEIGNLRALVDRYFAAIPRRANPIPLEIAARDTPRIVPRSVAATAPNVPLPVTGTLWQIPGMADPDMAAIEVLDAILTMGENSRFYEALVRSGKAVDVSEIVWTGEEAGLVAQYATANPAADMAEVSGILAAEMERIRTQP